MTALNRRRRALPCAAVRADTPLPALQYACNLYRAVDRRMPEAAALARWLTENAAVFGLLDNVLPDEESVSPSLGRGVKVADWAKVGTALDQAASDLPPTSQSTIARWVTAIGRRLRLDAWEKRILALALQYRLDRRIERLFDAISECRGGRRASCEMPE